GGQRREPRPGAVPGVAEELLEAGAVGAAVAGAHRVRRVHRVDHLLTHQDDDAEHGERAKAEHRDRERPDRPGRGRVLRDLGQDYGPAHYTEGDDANAAEGALL